MTKPPIGQNLLP